MNLDGLTLASWAVGAGGLIGAAAWRYMGSINSRLADHEKRLSAAETADAGSRVELVAIARTNGELAGEIHGLSKQVADMRVQFAKIEERLDIRREILGVVGQRSTDR